MGNPISRELFLQRARARFGDKYDYSIKIRCTMHPVKQISITPEKHLQTTGGCKFCLREMRIQQLERELGRDSAVHPALTEARPDLLSDPLPSPAVSSRLNY
jgi:hypothetical protein